MAILKNVKDMQNIGLASMGSVLEYFDFQVYVFVAVYLSRALFPPHATVWSNEIKTFGIFAIGYLVRPIAGMIIAHFADRIGRKKLFIMTVLAMAVATFLMGCLPTYAQVGWLSWAALLTLRVFQGFALGGELIGGAVFVCEHAEAKRLGLASGIFFAVVNCGLLLGAGAAAIAKQVSGLDPALVSMTWRLPFLMGGVFGLIAAYLRRHLAETPLFEQVRREQKIAKRAPLLLVLRDYRWQCLFALALTFVFATTPGIYFQFLPTYLIANRHFQAADVFNANVLGVAAFVLSMPCWGTLLDRFGYARMLALAGVLNAGAALWFFNYLPTLPVADGRLIAAIVLVGMLCGVTHSLIAAMICSLFPTPIRQSGFAFPYSIGTALVSGLTPLVMATLVRSYGLSAPIFQAVLGGAVALILAAAVRHLPLYLGTKAGDEPALLSEQAAMD
jgi:MFS family permease